MSEPNYKSFFKMLSERRFYSSESIHLSIKNSSIRNLISDLNYQVKENVTKYFDGYFYNSQIGDFLPCIEFYEVKNMVEFKKDIDLSHNFFNDFGRYYSLQDELIEVYMSDTFGEFKPIQVVKQIGHGNKTSRENDLTNYDSLESYYLLKGLLFPCVFTAIIENINLRLNVLKREIYDQIKSSNAFNPILNFFYWMPNKKYRKLKRQMVQILMTLKRFENEFTNEKLEFYVRDSDLHKFVTRDNYEKNHPNLLSRILHNVKSQIDNLNNKTKSLNDIFKPLEEYNIYSTNLWLQRTSITVAVLVFIFTFPKTKALLAIIWHYLVKIL